MELQCWWAFDPEMHSPFQINLNSWFELEFIKCQQFFFFFFLGVKGETDSKFWQKSTPFFFLSQKQVSKNFNPLFYLFNYLFYSACFP
jgi:hypothetical protein